jgi:hypothetical protein
MSAPDPPRACRCVERKRLRNERPSVTASEEEKWGKRSEDSSLRARAARSAADWAGVVAGGRCENIGDTKDDRLQGDDSNDANVFKLESRRS